MADDALIVQIVRDFVGGQPFAYLKMDSRDGSEWPADPEKSNHADEGEGATPKNDFGLATLKQSDKPLRRGAAAGNFSPRGQNPSVATPSQSDTLPRAAHR